MGFGFTYDIELNTEQPFIVELDLNESNYQTLSGAIALKLDRSESFKVATIAIHGHSKFSFSLMIFTIQLKCVMQRSLCSWCSYAD
jgi:hypothetical protein